MKSKLALWFSPALGFVFCVCLAQAQNGKILCGLPGSALNCVNAQTTATVATPSVKTASSVTYTNGQLAIHARNASMRDILRAVSTQTGATVEFPSGSVAELVYLDAGPGPIREVLATLLNGSKFNYVMLGSPEDSASLTRLILSNVNPSGGTAGVPSMVAQAPQPALYGQGFTAAETDGSETETPAVPVPIPAATVNAAATATAGDPSGKSQGEVLGALQKEFMRKLHDQQQAASQPQQ